MDEKTDGFRRIFGKCGRAKQYDVSFRTITECDGAKMKNEETGSYGLGYRHLVAFWCFYYFFILNAHTISMPIALVAMVNHTQSAKEIRYMNSSITSCPLPEVTENISVPLKQGTFQWNSQLQGYILSAGSLVYILTNFFGGRVAERFGVKRTIMFSDVICVACAAISPAAAEWNIYALIVVQLVKGLGQGLVNPSVFVMLANWFPRNERGLLSSLGVCGGSVGCAIAGIVFGSLCDVPSLGWPAIFYFIGGFNLCMAVLFIFTFYEVPKIHPSISKAELSYITNGQESDMSRKRPPTPWRIFFTSLPVYALVIGKTGFYWSLGHFIFIHPTYMGTVLHFSMTKNGVTTMLLFVAMTAGTVIAMFTSNWLRKKNYLCVDKLRKSCNSISAIGSSMCIVSVLLSECNTTINIVCCALGMVFIGIGVSGAMIVSGDMSPTFTGSLSGISAAVPMIGANMMPIIVGALIKNGTLGEWRVVFLIYIAVVLGSAIFFYIFGSAEIQPWDSIQPPASKLKTVPTVCKVSDQKSESQFEDSGKTNYI